MRKILYKGKRIDNGKWFHGNLLQLNKLAFIVPSNAWFKYGELTAIVEVIPETVGQYTGLTDKNGKKIFEGDIVKYGDTVHKVVFEQRNGTAYFGLVYNELETLPFGHYQDLRQIEIIGNLHDNCELME